ncbi:LamB/YcsF family protein [Ideonella sp. A 288]|uniref:LamB/YcsF family protein n=1 Tax=Ideonella sp. A 288 TaxID=1962181 RepID=UPI000B4B8497|nr:5-oxoprolinase subunit PxpA [Ideonella sp. A 288]
MDINLNSDLGESYGAWRMGDDRALLSVVGSANVACGFHAGDPLVMADTVRRAGESGVSLGAHPSFPDLQGFGRRAMQVAPAELAAMVTYQVGALMGIAQSQGQRVTHVKPHGAMNNMACEDAAMAATIAAAVKALDPRLILLAPALSELAAAGRAAGLRVADEVFADRAYTEQGTLVPRSQPGAVLHDSADCLAHVLRMMERGGIVTVSGRLLPCSFHSICVHGDSAHAVATAAAVRDGLRAAGHRLRALPELFGPG